MIPWYAGMGNGFFVGREPELARLMRLDDDEPIAVIYGVPGIGKTELAYKALADLEARTRWRGVPVTTVVVGGTARRGLQAVLRAALRTERELVDVLTHERHLVLLDDAHEASDAAAELIDALLRRRAQSRLVVTSREQLPVVTAPLVVRLGPLDREGSAVLVTRLAERLGIHPPPIEPLIEQAHGNPFYLRRLLVANQGAMQPDPLADLVGSLSPDERATLLRLAAVATCSGSRRVADRVALDARNLQALNQKLLIDLEPQRVQIHELIVERVMRDAAPEPLREARATGSEALWELFREGGQPLHAIESLCLLSSAGAVDAALARCDEVYPQIARSGLDHLLLPILERVGDAGHPRAWITAAQIQLRMSQIDDAARSLAKVPPTELARDPKALGLHGLVAERSGAFAIARDAFARAQAASAVDGISALLYGLHLAGIHAMTGELEAAQQLLDRLLPAARTRGDRWLARWSWYQAIKDTFALDWNSAQGTASAGRTAAVRAGAADLDYLLAAIELLAAAELGQVDAVSRLTDELQRSSAHGLRARMGRIFLGIAQVALGSPATAIDVLRPAYDELRAGGDNVLALVAGHYLARASMHRGDLATAIAMFEHTAQRGVEAGLHGVIDVLRVYLARAQLSAGRADESARLTDALIGAPNPRVRIPALAIRAFEHAACGEIISARTAIAAARAMECAECDVPLLIDEAEVEAFGGDHARARSAASTALARLSPTSQPYLWGRAQLAWLFADARRDPAELVDVLDRIEPLVGNGRLPQLDARVQVLRALAAGDPARAIRALTGVVPRGLPQATGGLLRFLGLAPDTLVAETATGRHLGGPDLAELEARERDLVIDLASDRLIARGGRAALAKRPQLCQLLARLARDGAPASAEELYRSVWGGRDFHPLRHRNTVYIGLNRAKKALAQLGLASSVVRRHDGWLLAPSLDVCVVRAAAEGATASR